MVIPTIRGSGGHAVHTQKRAKVTGKVDKRPCACPGMRRVVGGKRERDGKWTNQQPLCCNYRRHALLQCALRCLALAPDLFPAHHPNFVCSFCGSTKILFFRVLERGTNTMQERAGETEEERAGWSV